MKKLNICLGQKLQHTEKVYIIYICKGLQADNLFSLPTMITLFVLNTMNTLSQTLHKLLRVMTGSFSTYLITLKINFPN